MKITKRKIRKIIQEVIQESIPDSVVKRLTPISRKQKTRITGESDITEKPGPVMQFRILKTGTGEFRAASNRRDQRLGGYRIEQLEQQSGKSHWAKSVLSAIELLTKETNFPVMEWRDVHYHPTTQIIKHFRRGLPLIGG